MGTASATEDISTDIVSDSVDDVAVDAVQEEISDSSTVDDTTEPTVSDDTTTEEINKEIIELNRGTPVNASNWADLETQCESSGSKEITLNGTIYNANTQINFKNSATIIGTPNSYITGGISGDPTFLSSGSYNIHFINVTFRDINSDIFIKFSTTGVNKFDNCTFSNIYTTTSDGHSSVIWNNGGLMNITNCNFTNCNNGFGVITNHKTPTTVTMNVNNCRFENNYGRTEPGAINNCGKLNVTNSTFTNNTSYQWAGAIHTHSNAYTRIINSNFTENNAGWNGGSLYTYSKLEVINCTFTNNSCNTSAGGGAIGCSNWMSRYNITVCNCTFINNTNNCGVTNETPSTGTGGAISAMNNGYLTVCGSTFDNNYAGYGQAIAAYSQGYVNITAGIPNVVIKNNTFLNHNRTNTTDTVALTGNYTLDNNTFINCHQENVGTNNKFINCTPTSVNNVNLEIMGKRDLLTLNKKSSTNALKNAIEYLTPQDDIVSFIRNIENNGIIYLGVGEFFIDTYIISSDKNYTIIGQSRDDTLLIKRFDSSSSNGGVKTFINLTISITEALSDEDPIQTADLSGDTVFINCTFISTPLNIGKELFDNYIDTHGGLTSKGVYSAKFYNCDFLNCDRENNYLKEIDESYVDEETWEYIEKYTYHELSSYMNVFDHANVELYDCTFDNLNYEKLICTNVANYDTGSVKIYNSTFRNCAINAVLDYYNDLEDLFTIEDCTYDFDVTTDVITSEDNGHHYVNATKLKVVAVDSAVDISSTEKGVIVIALTDNSSAPIAGATVKYTVNGGEEQTDVTGEDGKFTITGLTGEVTIAVSYEGNESFNAITGSQFFNFTEETATNGTDDTPAAPTKVATKLTAPKVTATYNVAKKLVITLKDANGKVLANKKVTVKVGTISKTLKTNAKGQVSVAVNTLVPKTYTATIKFAGDSSYKASSVSAKVVVKKAAPKLTAAKKTFKVKAKTKKVTATLKNNKGKILKKVKLTIKIGKKTYTAKTNSKGVATFKVKLTKKGTYTGTVKFAGNKYFKAATKKVKIAVKK